MKKAAKIKVPPMAALSIVVERRPRKGDGFDASVTLKCYDKKGKEMELDDIEKYALQHFLATIAEAAAREGLEHALGYSEDDDPVIPPNDDYTIF